MDQSPSQSSSKLSCKDQRTESQEIVFVVYLFFYLALIWYLSDSIADFSLKRTWGLALPSKLTRLSHQECLEWWPAALKYSVYLVYWLWSVPFAVCLACNPCSTHLFSQYWAIVFRDILITRKFNKQFKKFKHWNVQKKHEHPKNHKHLKSQKYLNK